MLILLEKEKKLGYAKKNKKAVDINKNISYIVVL